MARKNKDTTAIETADKPKKKKWWLIVIIALVVIIGLFGCGGNGEENTTTENDNTEVAEEQTTEEQTTEEETTEESGEVDKKALAKELKEKYDLKGGSSVRNDATDSWTIESIANADAIDPTVWAYDYVQAYWEKGIKVMWVVNFANNTTTSINTDDGSMIFITQHDYVEDEEHDAKALGAGTVLGDWVMYHDDNGELVCESTME